MLVSPQEDFHTLMLSLLENDLRRTVPGDLRVRREMSVILGPRQRPEPDVIVFHATGLRGPDATAYRAEDLVLAVEVVSPESEERDRKRKPSLYAGAGIPHFWLVESSEWTPYGERLRIGSDHGQLRPVRHPPRTTSAHDTVRHRHRPDRDRQALTTFGG
ncbi:Uma2 family endonuclease [Sphaerisporangium sp. NPDC004334]